MYVAESVDTTAVASVKEEVGEAPCPLLEREMFRPLFAREISITSKRISDSSEENFLNLLDAANQAALDGMKSDKSDFGIDQESMILTNARLRFVTTIAV